jgi:hypothetical protein
LRAPFEATTHLQLATKIKSGKIERIPPQYSDDLMAVITSMIIQEPDKRPSVEKLLSLPHIAARHKELKIREKKEWIKRKEADVKRREQNVKEKEAQI